MHDDFVLRSEVNQHFSAVAWKADYVTGIVIVKRFCAEHSDGSYFPKILWTDRGSVFRSGSRCDFLDCGDPDDEIGIQRTEPGLI